MQIDDDGWTPSTPKQDIIHRYKVNFKDQAIKLESSHQNQFKEVKFEAEDEEYMT